MKLHSILATCVLGGMLAGCASSSQTEVPPIPTPLSQPIAVVSRYHLPAGYTVVGTVTGYTIDMLKDKARKLGADAIINPRKVDPVSGWATTEAIKYGK